MPATPVIRPARPEDCEAILRLMEHYYAEDGYPFVPVEAAAAVSRLLAEPALGRMWVFAEGDEVVGYAALTLGYSLEYRGRDAFVDELYLRPDRRGTGAGMRALGAMEDACRELGVRALHLEAEREKPRLLGFYGRAGFASHDRHLLTKVLRAR